MPRYSRSASFVITLFGTFSNFAVTVQLLALWRPLFEWEAAGDTYRVGGIKLVWGLLSAYFALAASVCTLGFIGVVKVRQHRFNNIRHLD